MMLIFVRNPFLACEANGLYDVATCRPNTPLQRVNFMAENLIPEAGDRAPAFHLPTYPEGRIRLSKFKGEKNVVLYFYPKDDTPGCTTEACGFRDDLKTFDATDTVILGISPDSIASHEKFAKKYSLPFTLLADEERKTCEKYGVWIEKNMYGRKYMGVQRATFLIDKRGIIAAAWPKVKVKGHVEEVATAVGELD
jgi:thioredoxin-dependent peroxiredoxin